MAKMRSPRGEGGGGEGGKTLPYAFFLQNLKNRPFVASHSLGYKTTFLERERRTGRRQRREI